MDSLLYHDAALSPRILSHSKREWEQPEWLDMLTAVTSIGGIRTASRMIWDQSIFLEEIWIKKPLRLSSR